MTATQIPHVTIDVAMHVEGEPTGATTRFESATRAVPPISSNPTPSGT